jgi:hypothetical protein
VKRLETLDRRTSKTILDTGRQDYSAASTSPYITLYIQPKSGTEEELKQCITGDMLAAFKAIKGWKRTKIHDVVDSLVISAKSSPQANTAAKYLVVNGRRAISIRKF